MTGLSSAELSPANCDAFLLSAGFGKRLKALTTATPKPLVLLHGRPLIDWNLELLSRSGFRRVFVNLHYLGEQIADFLGDGSRWGVEILYSREPILLDTGGGIKNIEHRLQSEALVTINSDVLLGRDFDYQKLLNAHRAAGPDCIATLTVRVDTQAERFGALRVDEAGRVIRFLDESLPTDDGGSQSGLGKESSAGTVVMYAGVQVLSRAAFDFMPPAGSVFSITKDTYRMVIRQGGLLSTYLFEGYWSDVGTPERLESASKDFIPQGDSGG